MAAATSLPDSGAAAGAGAANTTGAIGSLWAAMLLAAGTRRTGCKEDAGKAAGKERTG